ncbi:ROK family protein [Pseudonocardia adelaidensis]|uniref:ROK family protein n=1 Tax=Pseudonocardia adelaidensis TaxID=648754 RepID=UPI0031ED57E3
MVPGRREVREDVAGRRPGVGPPGTPGARWGVAIPGPFDYAAGVGRFAGVGKFDALRGVALGEILAKELDAADVVFLNDAHAFGIGEWRAGTARGHDRVLVLTLGTGVGSCFLDRGTPVSSGPDVPPEGRADLLTIDGAPLEETVSRRALLARAGAGPGVDVRDLAERARAGDTATESLFTDAFAALGRAVAPWARRFGASLVVVGGAIAASWDLVAAPLHAGLSDGRAELPVVPASSGHAGLVGAAWWAHRF